MGIFKFLKNLICYISTGFLFSALVKLKTVISQVQEIFSRFFNCDNNSQCTRVHYTQSFSRETNRTRVINCDLLYHIIELLKFSAWIIQSPFLLHQYDYILHAFIFTCPPIINHVSDQYSVCFCLHIRGVVVRAYYIGNLRLPSHQVNI